MKYVSHSLSLLAHDIHIWPSNWRFSVIKNVITNCTKKHIKRWQLRGSFFAYSFLARRLTCERERESCTIIIRKNIHDKCDIKEVRGGSGNDCAYIRHMFNVITSLTPKSKSLNENWCLSMSCTATRVCFVTEITQL